MLMKQDEHEQEQQIQRLERRLQKPERRLQRPEQVKRLKTQGILLTRTI